MDDDEIVCDLCGENEFDLHQRMDWPGIMTGPNSMRCAWICTDCGGDPEKEGEVT